MAQRQPFSPELVENRADSELHELLACAYTIRERSNEDPEIDYSFTIILLGFLAANDPSSRWFQGYVSSVRININMIYSTKSVKQDDVQRAAPTKKRFAERSRFTESARSIFDEAFRFMEQTQGRAYTSSQLGVRHVLAAYIYGPGTHKQQLSSYGFDRVHWSNSFLNFIAQQYPQDNQESWREIHRFQFSQEPHPAAQAPTTSATQVVNDNPPGTARRTGQASGSIDVQGESHDSDPETSQLDAPDESAAEVVAPAQPTSQHAAPTDNASAADNSTTTDPITTPPTPVPRLLDWVPSYDSDGRSNQDLLGVDDDARPLAMLIAARDTVPPLSIGIFGNWGSGKTFFMGRLQQSVARIASEAQADPEIARTFYSKIVQIEFNAWHYIEGNLWASLMEHILTSLLPPQSDKEGDAQAPKLFDDLQFTDRQLQLAKDAEARIQQQLNAARNTLNDLTDEHNAANADLQEVSAWDVIELAVVDENNKQQIKALLRQFGFTDEIIGDQTRDLYAALRAARGTLTQGAGLLSTFNRGDSGRRILYVGLLLLISVAIGIGIKVLTDALGDEGLAQISGIVTGVATALGLAARWLRTRSEQMSNLLMQVEKANQTLDHAVDEKRAEQNQKIAAAEQNLRQLNAQLVAAQQERDRQQQRIEEIGKELQAISPERVLARFLQDRTESDDYRKYLGIPALVRRDFQALSDKIINLNKVTGSDLAQTDAEGAYINRIVLYIDDLDRCPPERVVQVLQAVHLLLAFPLFVVVVGVDARWIAHSLQRRFPGLLVHRMGARENQQERPNQLNQATPYDYLAKIFQIPLWLAQVTDEGSRSMLRGLVSPSIKLETPQPLASEESSLGDKPAELETSGEMPPPTPQPTTAGDIPDATAQETPPRLNPQNLAMRSEELQAMEELAPLLARTPRDVKRFVNVYRLIKAGIEEEDKQTAFIESGDFRAVLLLLAMDSKSPEAANAFYLAILSEDTHVNLGMLASKTPEMAELLSWLKRLAEDRWSALTIQQLAFWCNIVRRYSFHQA